MPLNLTATCTYSATATGVSLAALTTAMAAASVPVDASFLELMSLSVTSDNTAAVGQAAVRTIVLNLAQPPFLSTFNNNPAPALTRSFKGTIRSTSVKDTTGGVGARTVTVAYLDPSGGAQTNAGIVLAGTTKVTLGTTDHSQITGITILTFGADGANDGEIIIEDDGGTEYTRGVPKAVAPKAIGTLQPSFYTQTIPQGADPTADMIGDWMKLTLQGALGIPVTADAVVYA